MVHPRPLFHLFLSFPTNITNFTTNKCEKCPSSRQSLDLNPQPLEHESFPITTRPGLPPLIPYFLMQIFAPKMPNHKFDLLQVSSCGYLQTPKFPDNISGRDRFRGDSFHSSQWNRESELTGKRVAVIGSGASAVQIAPAIVDKVNRGC